MSKQHFGSILIAIALADFLLGCAKKADESCDCTYNDRLPQPAKIIRKGSGFEPTRYSFSLDLITGDAEYEKSDGLNEVCKGTLNVADELAEWKAATDLLACTRVLNNPISDGYIDSMILYFPNSETLPESLTTQVSEDWITVELQEKFVNSVDGKQQFDCTGQFEVDALINVKVGCLGIE